MRVRIHHKSTYRYPKPTTFGPHTIRLRPAPHTRTRILSYNLELNPQPRMHWQFDPWGNRILRANFEKVEPSEELSIAVDAAVEIHPVNPFDFTVDPSFEDQPAPYPERLAAELAPFREVPDLGAKTAAFAEAHPPVGRITDYLVELNRSVSKTVGYIIRNEPGIQTPEETLSIGTGSCRDSAHLLVSVLRARGFAARFVSGYLVQLTDEGNIPDQAKGIDRDVVDLHAWAEVYIPGAGWIGLDATSGLFTGEGHIPLAGTADPLLAGPVEGTAGCGADDLDVEMTVTRLGHEPRPRKPYTEEQWSALLEAGRMADQTLQHHSLKLTMGGEPTWTSRIHATEPEWNGEALGATKWEQGVDLTAELMKRLGEHGILLHRFGKHYPGESLPRWAMHLLWRKDGVALWKNREVFDMADKADIGKYNPEGPSVEKQEIFRKALLDALSLNKNTWLPAFEDPWPAVIEEEHLPIDVDPQTFDLELPEERRRLARVLDRGLNEAAGFVLPLVFNYNGFHTEDWTFRRKHLYLIPGDSPIGLRLPLQRIGGEPFELYEQDPSSIEPDAPLQPFRRRPDRLHDVEWDGPQAQVARRTRTALCTEVRAGSMRVFLPPVPTSEAFLGLLEAIEHAATQSEVPVALEGYPPPKDPRFGACLVTPDPGVLEVNLPVTDNFADYANLMDTVSDAANHASLTPEKFQIDGRTAGSGGGHHLTLGGPSTLESPFLRRPELTASLLRFFQNHPSLSYLFTGLFVGPTSQAPRVDEARLDALYELEIALKMLEGQGDQCPPWLVDRLLRNLLVDVEGNTHRTEISIDKLYDPGFASGRQGIMEFRAFEMPPHEHMAAAQMLLVRSIVARLAQKPYQNPLVRWGSQLHDRFMLPHFVWQDFQDVLRELGEGGLSLSPDWYRPFLDFRCPKAGEVTLSEGQTLEVRSALEPWPVLGEEGTPTGTVRYVDSSVERVEVKVRGLTPERHVVTVNGYQLPLRPTGEATEMVAGIRFKAWQPPHGLQPTLPTDHPLRIDVIDPWAHRSLGAATYHVWHPAGRGFNDPPLTAFEAAARRAQRFSLEGHAPYPVRVKVPSPHPEQPFTLDLRRAHSG